MNIDSYTGTIPVHLRANGKWFHSDDQLSKASLGEFFHNVLKVGAYVGEIWVFNRQYNRSGVYVSVFMTPEMKDEIEKTTKFRFRDPPKIVWA